MHHERASIAFIHSGSFFNVACLQDPALVAWNVTGLYARDIQPGQLDAFDGVYLAARQHHSVVHTLAPLLLDYVTKPGRRLVLDGENNVGNWLPNVTQQREETNFWAWRTGEDVGTRVVNEEHALWDYLSSPALIWHFHHSYTLPEGAVSLMQKRQPNGTERSLVFVDEGSYASPMVVLGMDPSYHHGAGFMPGATQLLYRMLDWLTYKPAV